MNELVFPQPLYERLASALVSDNKERAAILFANAVNRWDDGIRLLVTDIEQPPEHAYVSRGPGGAVLSPGFVLHAARQAQQRKCALVFAHSHPFSEGAYFSKVDDEGERPLAKFLDSFSRAPHMALVVARAQAAARRLGQRELSSVLEIGRQRRVRSVVKLHSANAVNDRQVRAIGPVGQAILQTLRVAVVGAGGTGSVVSQQLAHLGVRDLLIVDPDILEESNVSRVVAATSQDIGRSKAVILAESLGRIRPDVRVEALQASVLEARDALTVAKADFIFCCTDTHGSRAVIGQLAYQYLVPTIDLGVVIRTQGTTITHIAGRVHYLSPETGCLVCAGILDPAQVRRDLMNDTERAEDPYFSGPGEPQPAVIAFNSIVASSAVAMFLHAVTGVGTEAAMINYDGLRGTIRAAIPRRDAYCVVCSSEGALARGDGISSPARPS